MRPTSFEVAGVALVAAGVVAELRPATTSPVLPVFAASYLVLAALRLGPAAPVPPCGRRAS